MKFMVRNGNIKTRDTPQMRIRDWLKRKEVSIHDRIHFLTLSPQIYLYIQCRYSSRTFYYLILSSMAISSRIAHANQHFTDLDNASAADRVSIVG